MTADTIAARVQTVEKGLSCSRSDFLAIEEPLQFCLSGFPLSITMRSPGSDLDLATGFLFTGIIDDIGQILSTRAEPPGDSSEASGRSGDNQVETRSRHRSGRIRRALAEPSVNCPFANAAQPSRCFANRQKGITNVPPFHALAW